MNTEIAVIGGKADILPFKAAGFNTFELDAPIETNNSHTSETGASARNLTDLITQFADQGIGIIFITENLLADINNFFADAPLPVIIPIPGISGSRGIGTGAIRENIIRAAGADIIT